MGGDGVAIRVDGLVRSFGPTKAVDDVTFEVPRGTIFGFLGPNGAGKTTTINLLLGLLEPTAGRAEVLGQDPWREGDAVRSRTGAVLEHTGIYEALSARDNLVFHARIWGMTASERDARAEELLTRMGLWERRHERAGTWSRGMQQRLALARALIHRPALVFLDEPTAGLDVMAASEVRSDLAALADREGTTIFLTTHNMAEAERLCGALSVIRAGRVVAVGSPSHLRAQAGSSRVEILGRGLDASVAASLRECPEVARVAASDGRFVIDLRESIEPAPMINLLVRQGAEIDEVRRERASLEEVFVALMEEER